MKNKLKSTLPYIGIPIIGVALLYGHVGRVDTFTLLWWELIIGFGYIASVLDIRSKCIPNSLVLMMFGAWIITMIPKLFLDIDVAVILLKDALFGLIIGGGLFLLVYIISRKGLGGGDVKFMAASGLYIGFAGVLSAMFCGTVLAGVTGVILLLMKKMGRKDTMPLAPFLYIGILITVFYR